MKHTKQYVDVFNFSNTASAYLKESKENFVTRAIEKIKPKLVKIIDQYNEELDEIERKYCAITSDEYKTILRDEKGNFRFTPENQGKRNKEVTKLLYKEVEVPTHFVEKDRLPVLDAVTKGIFKGFVIAPDPTDATDQTDAQDQPATEEAVLNGSHK